MALKSKNCNIAIILFFCLSKSYGIKLKEIVLKEATNNLRYTTSDGNTSYYIKPSVGLMMAKNYTTKELIKDNDKSHFTVVASSAKKYIAIIKEEQYFSNLSILNLATIYTAPFGEAQAREVTKGLYPTLHLNDEWISIYQPSEKNLKFASNIKTNLEFNLPVNKIFYKPSVSMLNPDSLLYTDTNDSGYQVLKHYNRMTNQSNVIMALKTSDHRFEICSTNDSLYLYIGIFPQINHFHSSTSTIYKVAKSQLEIKKLDQFNLKNEKPIYHSLTYDYGHIICDVNDQKIYFLKNFSKTFQLIKSDVASIDVKTAELVQVTSEETINNLFSVDSILMTMYQGKNYLVL